MAALALGLTLTMTWRIAGDTQTAINTDKNRYGVGETMTINGTGFSPNATINLSVLRPDKLTEYVTGVSSDANGGFQAQYTPGLPLQPGRYRITATDGANTAVTAATEADAAAADLDQCRNGSSASPADCTATSGGGVGWVNGNVGSSQGHFIEGYSIPYRMKFTGLAPGTWTVDIGYDILHGGGEAIDFLTSDNQMNNPPHSLVFGHSPECVDATDGFFATADGCNIPPTPAATTFPIPKPNLPAPPAPCTPAVFTGATSCAGKSFDDLQAAGKENFTMWNATINSVAYVSQGNPFLTGGGDSETRMRIVFTVPAGGSTALLSWGGHIAREQDWGTGKSASGISGSPYHMRLKGLCGGITAAGSLCDTGGNQDRSLSSATVFNPPTLTLVKVVVNDNGGTKTVADFPLTATGPAVTITGVSGTPAVTGQVVLAGAYTLTEQTQLGYTASGWSCTAGTLNGNVVTLADGQSATCTITNNDDAPRLTLVKNVINDDGGTKTVADFPLSASGPTPISGVSGTAAVTNAIVSAGSYSLSETTQAGYTASSWTCTGTGTQTGSSIALALGQTATCTITNDDQAPRLTLVKNVINNNGGTKTVADFPLTATGPTPITGVSGTAAVTNAKVSVGSYALSEVTDPGYTASAWSCVGGTQTGSNIALALGQSATCTITNDDQAASLTLIKNVTNNNGGTKTVADFPLTATGPTPITGVSGTAAVTAATVNAGSYALSEVTDPGYTASSWSCVGGTQNGANITLALGQSATCTITNDDKPASLTLVKVVTNNNGGTKTITDFPLTATGPTPITGVSGTAAVTSATVNAGSYALSEQTQAGYTASTWSCVGGTQNGANITLALGQSATCTITNDDQTAHLKLVKVVTNNSGGTAVATDFTLSAAGPTPISGAGGAESDVNAGSYTLSETNLPGYTASAWSCVGGTQNGATISLALGQSATCTITNDDNAAHLTLVKNVINDNGGTATVANFPLTATGPTPITGVSGTAAVTNAAVNAGSYNLSEVTVAGYAASAWSCSGGSQSGATITLALGQSATCTITNNDIAPSLTLVKQVINDNGGTAQPTAWVLTANGGAAGTLFGPGGAVSGPGFKAGTYALSESTVTGYANGAYICTGTGTQVGQTIQLALAQSAVCTVTNNDIPGTIIVNKFSKGTTGTFTFSATGFTVPDITTTPDAQGNGTGTTGAITVNVGSYSVGENVPAGWKLDASFCTVDGTNPFGTATTVNGVNTSWTFNVPLATTVTCTFDNSVASGTTRTQGFWATHTELSNTIWNTKVPDADKMLCAVPITATNSPLGTNQLMGGFWANIANKTKGKRSDLDQARMQMLQQYLAATINVAEFGSNTEQFLADARTAYCGTSIPAIQSYIGILGSYNTSGDSGNFTPGISATAQDSRKQADIAFWDNTTH